LSGTAGRKGISTTDKSRGDFLWSRTGGVSPLPLVGSPIRDTTLGAVSTLGFGFKVKEDPSFQPEEYCWFSRTGDEDPTPRWGQKTM